MLLICCTAFIGDVQGQSPSAKTTSSDNASTRSQDESSSLGFSIESEMLTYRALESNSEAVACDIAAYLNGGLADFKNPPAATVCAVNAGANTKASIIIFPFDRSALDDFRLWRGDMETMNELRIRAARFSCPAAIQVANRGTGSALALTPAGSALSLAQGVLGIISSDTSISRVGGTIGDQAFMNGVARQLRSLNVRVMMPGT
jgi:hypothetical protein